MVAKLQSGRIVHFLCAFFTKNLGLECSPEAFLRSKTVQLTKFNLLLRSVS